jgi:cation:H+ antiporter
MFIKALLGVFGLLIASNLIVEAVIEVGEITEINESFIGLFVLALGTNTPELIMLITAKKKGLETERLVTGNFIGSVCANIAILGVLGVMSRGIVIDNFIGLVPVLLIGAFASLFFAIFSWTGRTLTRNEGILLVSLYGSFVITELIIIFTA